MKSLLKYLFCLIGVGTLLSSCIEDRVSTSPAHQPTFSTDTLDLGLMFSQAPSTTHAFRVYNRHNRSINLQSVAVREGNDIFRLNVDGTTGTTFSNIEVRARDSIFVLVEATVPGGEPVMAHIDFVTSGVTRSVVLTAEGIDVERHRGTVITADTRWDAMVPRQIFDSLVVAPGATLRLDPGATLHFHDGAFMRVEGMLLSEGTPEAPVTLTGDRTGNVVADIPFDLMASQWQGLTFAPTASGSLLSHTVVKNMSAGVLADSVRALPDGTPGLTIRHSRIRNSASYAFASLFSDLRLVASEFSDAAYCPLLLFGGNITANHLTVANYYLFSAIEMPLLTLMHLNDATAVEGTDAPLMSATFDNCILYGLGQDISIGNLDDTDVYIRRTLFKTPDGTDDTHFINEMWGTDPLFLTVRDEYIFDYRPAHDSPVVNAHDPALTLPEAEVDMYGLPLNALGAFAPAPAP